MVWSLSPRAAADVLARETNIDARLPGTSKISQHARSSSYILQVHN